MPHRDQPSKGRPSKSSGCSPRRMIGTNSRGLFCQPVQRQPEGWSHRLPDFTHRRLPPEAPRACVTSPLLANWTNSGAPSGWIGDRSPIAFDLERRDASHTGTRYKRHGPNHALALSFGQRIGQQLADRLATGSSEARLRTAVALPEGNPRSRRSLTADLQVQISTSLPTIAAGLEPASPLESGMLSATPRDHLR